MDLSNFSSTDLRELQAQVTQELERREVEEKKRAREEIQRIMSAAGLSMNDLMGSGLKFDTARKPKKTVEARYRHPDHTDKTWSGRGRQPLWVKEWLEAGKALDGLKI